jgi:hypothetical protein
MSASRKSLAERVRERAWAIHRRNHRCKDWQCGPTLTEREQAKREVMRSERSESP